MLFWKFILASIRSQTQYRASFLMLLVGYFLGTFVDILGIWVLFDRFKMVHGWTLFEVGLIYGTIQIGFALAEAFARGFDTFGRMIKHGDFDRILLRPLSPLFQIAFQEFQLMRIGRLLQGLCILVWSLKELSIPFLSIYFLMIVLSIFGVATLFYGLFVIQATISFWTIETLELMNITTYGGLQTGQYPMSIYSTSFRWIFTLLIPLSCVAYYPIAAFLKHEPISLGLGMCTPFAGFIFLYLACQFWRFGINRYSSVGS
jgi:ABC-2 type transport system permease protein